jgi:fructose-1,6-bisphosphatase I
MQKLVTVQRHLVESQRKYPEATGDLTSLLWDLTLAFKIISREVNKAGLAQILGTAGETNASGDDVMKLDRYSQDVLYRAMDHGGHLCCMASEEEPEIIPIPERYPKGKYVLAFDPLDGSSNIDANVSVGTIFTIHRRKTPVGTDGTLEDVLQPARDLVAAGYIVYGSSTMMVYSTGHGVHGFTLDPSVGEFFLSHENIRIPERGRIYSVNEGYQTWWDERTRRFVEYLKSPAAGPYKSRYIGSMVSDVHRTLLYGGIFLYPRTYKTGPQGEAKLRLLYEAAPMAFIVENAGGMATTGEERLLDIVPKELHERVPIILGGTEEVSTFLAYHRGER